MLEDLPRPHRPSDARGMDPARNVIGVSKSYMPPSSNAGASALAPGSAPAPSAAAPAAAPAAAASAPPTAGSPAAMWDRAHAQANAQHGRGPRRDAFTPPASTASLIEKINDGPEALSLLAERSRSGNLTEAEGLAALEAMRPPRDKPPRAGKAAKKTAPKAVAKGKPVVSTRVKPAAARSGLSRFKLGFRGIRS